MIFPIYRRAKLGSSYTENYRFSSRIKHFCNANGCAPPKPLPVPPIIFNQSLPFPNSYYNLRQHFLATYTASNNNITLSTTLTNTNNTIQSITIDPNPNYIITYTYNVFTGIIIINVNNYMQRKPFTLTVSTIQPSGIITDYIYNYS